jgi:hypothetical protein
LRWEGGEAERWLLMVGASAIRGGAGVEEDSMMDKKL